MALEDDRLSRVRIAGRSWENAAGGSYCFEAAVDGARVELQVSEEVAFYFLNAWAPGSAKCIEILRLHRADLARVFDWMIRGGYAPDGKGAYCIDARDMYAFAGVRRQGDAGRNASELWFRAGPRGGR